MVAMSTKRCSITKPCGQARLVEQTRRLINEFIKVPKGQHLVAYGEHLRQRRTELAQDRRAASRSLKKSVVNPSYLTRVHGIEHTSSRPEHTGLLLADNVTANLRGTCRGLADPSGNADAVQLQRNSFGHQPLKQTYTHRVHRSSDDKGWLGASRAHWTIPSGITGLGQVIHRQVKIRSEER